MRATFHAEPDLLLAKADEALRSDPFSTNVIAVVAARIAAGAEPDRGENLWATVADSDGRVVGLAMHTPPHPLFVSAMPEAAAVVLANALAEMGRELSGVNGATGSTVPFARAWRARTGQPSRVVTAMRMYRLEDLSVPPDVAGASRTATSDDVGLLTDWFAAFHDEAQAHAPVQDWAALAMQRATARGCVLWVADGLPRALAGVSAPAAGVARVGPVYTPPQWRRLGYGSAVTAAATAAALGSGAQHVVLYTDLGNETSNSIYQAIGYRADHDAEERAFGMHGDVPAKLWPTQPSSDLG